MTKQGHEHIHRVHVPCGHILRCRCNTTQAMVDWRECPVCKMAREGDETAKGYEDTVTRAREYTDEASRNIVKAWDDYMTDIGETGAYI